jgi:hypothetical protein
MKPLLHFPPLILIAAGLTGLTLAPAWLGMWLLAGSIFLAAKWLMWHPHRQEVRAGMSAAWFLLWPGMDPAWLRRGTPARVDSPGRGWVHLAIGLALLLGVAPRLTNPLAAGWAAMGGLINGLHFGAFHLLACFWQRRGRHAPLVMNHPLSSRTLAEFWGRRWNTAFHILGERLVFRKLVRKWGAQRAMLAVFFVSGLVHDAVITLPARGGWGLPTLYFLIQGAGFAAERRWRLRHHAWVWSVTGLPVMLCFPPPFCERVIAPLLDWLR